MHPPLFFALLCLYTTVFILAPPFPLTHLHIHIHIQARPLYMGPLNAANLKKQQKGGKKAGKGGKGKGGGDGQPRGNSVIDTNKRECKYVEYIYTK
jgi:hypothetical protein